MGHVLKQIKTENEKEKTKKIILLVLRTVTSFTIAHHGSPRWWCDKILKIIVLNVEEIKKLKPTAGFLNPPLEKTVATSKYELEYVLNNLECLAKILCV